MDKSSEVVDNLYKNHKIWMIYGASNSVSKLNGLGFSPKHGWFREGKKNAGVPFIKKNESLAYPLLHPGLGQPSLVDCWKRMAGTHQFLRFPGR